MCVWGCCIKDSNNMAEAPPLGGLKIVCGSGGRDTHKMKGMYAVHAKNEYYEVQSQFSTSASFLCRINLMLTFMLILGLHKLYRNEKHFKCQD